VVRIAGSSHGNYIEVADDGSGMTHDALLQGFMRLATNDKVEPRYLLNSSDGAQAAKGSAVSLLNA
jgi:hypothetical protein